MSVKVFISEIFERNAKKMNTLRSKSSRKSNQWDWIRYRLRTQRPNKKDKKLDKFSHQRLRYPVFSVSHFRTLRVYYINTTTNRNIKEFWYLKLNYGSNFKRHLGWLKAWPMKTLLRSWLAKIYKLANIFW